jgi:hypothetical protein
MDEFQLVTCVTGGRPEISTAIPDRSLHGPIACLRGFRRQAVVPSGVAHIHDSAWVSSRGMRVPQLRLRASGCAVYRSPLGDRSWAPHLFPMSR